MATSKSLKALKILQQRKKLSTLPHLFTSSFPQQQAFCDDPAKLKAIFCTRRAAKSFTVGLYLVKEALENPNCNCLFIGLTRSSAKAIIWKDILHVLNKKHSLNIRFNQSELSASFPNGSLIKVTGVDAEESEMNKLLGSKYRLVCIDEASMYTIDLSNLVYGVLKPAMVDPNSGNERGVICLTGTSSNFARGLFYDITTGKEPGWSLHSWTAHDNPFISKQWQEELDEIKAKRPLYMDTPQFKQWYLNQWTVDEEKLVYKFNYTLNTFNALPLNHSPSGWNYILGVDTGWEDDNAFVLTAYHESDKTLYIVKTFNKPKMTFDQVADKILEFMNDSRFPPTKIVIDGANKQGVESMRKRSNIPFEFADKKDKVTFIELLNSDLVQGNIKLHSSCHTLINELMSLVWKTNGEKISYPKKEHPALPNHLCDALLYSWRCGYHYQNTPKDPKIIIGTKAWISQLEDNIWEKEYEYLTKEDSVDYYP